MSVNRGRHRPESANSGRSGSPRKILVSGHSRQHAKVAVAVQSAKRSQTSDRDRSGTMTPAGFTAQARQRTYAGSEALVPRG